MHRDLAGDSRHHFPALARLALDRVAQDERAIAGLACERGGSLERSLRSRDDARFAASEGRAAWFGSLGPAVLEQRPHRRRRNDAIAAQHGLRVRERRLSGIVGPEAITDGSSPGTSEMINDTTLAGAAATANRPPLIAERRLRAQLISWMLAPLLRSALFKACLSSNLIPGAGCDSRADPPPDMRQSAKSSGPRPLTRSRILRTAIFPAASGMGWAASTISIRFKGPTPWP
jgi:hypothetical protein